MRPIPAFSFTKVIKASVMMAIDGRGGAQPTNQPRVTMPSITRVSSSTEKPHSRDSDGRAKLRISERCAVPGL
ncbi:hypothetical protein GW17_00058022 [Ensete ventricosum]|nr:hypothetical protein GW17_00058022 [Ensete ventricosum]